RATELEPNNPDWHESLAEFYRQAPSIVGGGIEKAYAEAAMISRTDPVRGHVVHAAIASGEKRYDEAVADYEAALKLSPDNYISLYSIGRLAVVTGRNLGRGLECLRRCLDLTQGETEPSHAAVQWRIGNVLEKKGDVVGARAAYETALKI